MSSPILRPSFSLHRVSVVSPTVGSLYRAIQAFLTSELARCQGDGAAVSVRSWGLGCNSGNRVGGLSSSENGWVSARSRYRVALSVATPAISPGVVNGGLGRWPSNRCGLRGIAAVLTALGSPRRLLFMHQTMEVSYSAPSIRLW